MVKKMKVRIPGITFSWKRLFGINKVKRKIAGATGIPTTKQGRKNKLRRKIFPF